MSVSYHNYCLLILADTDNWELVWDERTGSNGLGNASSLLLGRFLQNEAKNAT